ncbi:MAG: hypothetical protein PHE78_00785 [Candidatus Gastranaerophilales bacterium]|nr:hypothetical protein [Candidatus Gastranaerophilales bacterium]
METKRKLTVLRNILYCCFALGLLFLIIAALLYLPCKCFVANVYQGAFGIDISSYQNMWVYFVGLIKVILIFLFLVPAIAVHLVSLKQD